MNRIKILTIAALLLSQVFLHSPGSAKSESPKPKKKIKQKILILSEKGIAQDPTHRYHKKLIRFLTKKTRAEGTSASKRKIKVTHHTFEPSEDINALLKTQTGDKEFTKIYVFLKPLDYSRFIAYHKNVAEWQKALNSQSKTQDIKFHFHKESKLVQFTYHLFLEYMSGIQIIKDTQALIQEFAPDISKYSIYKVNYENQVNQLDLPEEVNPKTSCFSSHKSEKMDLERKSSSLYGFNRAFTPEAVKYESLFHCFFQSQDSKKRFVYEIIYPRPQIKLFPREVLFFYEPKTIVEKEFQISSDILIPDAEFLMLVKNIHGKPPLLFSDNQKWKWSAKKKSFSLLNARGKPKKFDIEGKHALKIAVLGERTDGLSGVLQLKNQGKKLAEFDVTFKPHIFGGNIMSLLLIYIFESTGLIFLVIFIWLYRMIRKRKKIKLESKPGISLGEFVFMIKEPQKILLSKNKNPFGCLIPFIDKEYILKINGSIIDLETKDDERVSVNLNESLGKANLNLGKRGEILFTQQKFKDRGENSVVIMKLQEKT